MSNDFLLSRYYMAKLLKKEEMQKIEDKIKKFFDMFGIVLRPPVDVFQVAGLVGFDVRAAELSQGFDGVIVVNEYTDKIKNFDSNKVIAYNVANNIQNKKFVVSHELGHYINEKMNNPEKRVIIAFRDRSDVSYSENEEEQNIDYCAAAILMPLISMKDDVKRIGENLSEEDLIQFLSDKYRVSLEVAKRRLNEIRILES